MNTKNKKIKRVVESYNFRFEITGLLNEYVYLQLFNGEGEIILKGYREIESTLPKGLYELHIQSNVKFETKTIRLNKDYWGTWKNHGLYSSITNNLLESSHEYYTNTSNHWSLHPTTNQEKNIKENSSLFLFFRYPDKEILNSQKKVAKSMGWRFSLLDSNRNTLYQLGKDNIKENTQEGWMAFHVCVNPGIYFILYKGQTKKEIPIYVYQGWQTQFYIIFKKTPIFQTTRIQMVKENEPFLYNKDLELDIILQNMLNGIYYIPERLIVETAYEKWENPMLAIVVSYAYLLSSETKHDELFKLIITNLQNKILKNQNSPDIKAIQLLSSIHFKEEIPTLNLDEPCMLKVGMKIFLEQEIENPERISISTKCKEILTNLHGDTIWTSYSPISENKLPKIEEIKSYYPRFRVKNKTIGFTYSFPNEDFKLETKQINNDWISQSLMHQLSDKEMSNISLKDLAKQYQITIDQIQNRIENIENLISFKKTIQPEIENPDSPYNNLNIDIFKDTNEDTLYKHINILMNKNQ